MQDGLDDAQTSAHETADSVTSFVLVFRAPDFVDEFSETCKQHQLTLGHWFNLIALHARGAPVFLVGTHKDELRPGQLKVVQRVVGKYVRKLNVVVDKVIRIQLPPDSGATERVFFDVDNTVCLLNLASLSLRP